MIVSTLSPGLRVRIWCTVLLLGAAVAGCRSDSRSRFAYTISPPPGWEAVPDAQKTVLTPGRVLEAYRAQSGGPASLVIFQTGYKPGTTPAEALVEMRYLLLNLPSLTLRSEAVVTVAGAPAARLEAVADGDGAAFFPTTLGKKPEPPAGKTAVPTHRVWIKLPRARELGTLEVFFHAPESDWAQRSADLEKALGTLRVSA